MAAMASAVTGLPRAMRRSDFRVTRASLPVSPSVFQRASPRRTGSVTSSASSAACDTQAADEAEDVTEPVRRGEAPWKTLGETGKLARATRKSDLLIARGKPVTAEAIAAMCGCSSRTAGTYLRRLRKVEGGRVPYEAPALLAHVEETPALAAA